MTRRSARSRFKVQGLRFKVQGSTFKVWILELGTRNSALGTRKPRLWASGFTIVELVVTIMIIGIMAAVIGPRFVGRGTFDSRAFYDEAQMVVRYAQKTAIAWRRPVYICINSNSISAGTVSDCSSLIAHPLTGDPLTTTAPSGVALSPTSFSFDGGGRPNPNAQTTIAFSTTITGDSARQLVVEAETGYAHP